MTGVFARRFALCYQRSRKYSPLKRARALPRVSGERHAAGQIDGKFISLPVLRRIPAVHAHGRSRVASLKVRA
jgi:hypothetical protein